jgi:hypothetical protein
MYEAKGAYALADGGFREAYDPVIYGHLNNESTFYAQSKKETSPSTTYRFYARVSRNNMVGPVTSTDVLVGGSAGKLKLEHQLKQYRAAVAIEDAVVLEANQNGIDGLKDAFAKELTWALEDLSKDLNGSFFGSGLTSGFGNAVDGLTGLLVDSGSVYGQSRVTYSTLKAIVSTTVGAFTLAKARAEITKARKAGARNLVIYTTWEIRGYFLQLMEATRYYQTTDADGGFAGALMYDGIPIVADADCSTGYMYVLDRDAYHIAEFKKFGLGKELGDSTLTSTKYIWGILDLVFNRFNTSVIASGITAVS